MANTDTQLLSNMGFALKKMYAPRMMRMIFEEEILLRNLMRRSARMGLGGDTMILSFLTSTVESFRATTEDGSLARPTVLDGFTAEVPKRVMTSTVQFSHLTDLYTREQRMSYIQTKRKLMDETARGFRRKLNEIFYMDGTGAIARINGAPQIGAPNTTIVVDDELVTGSSNTYGTKYIRKHQRHQFSANKAGTSLERSADLQVTKVTGSTFTLLYKGTIVGGDLQDGDFIFPEGSKNLMPVGLEGIIDDGGILDTYLNVSRATQEEWKSHVTNNVLATNIENHLLKIANKIRAGVAAGMDDALRRKSGWVALTTPGVVQSWFEQINPERRFIIEQMTKNAVPVYKGGFDDVFMWTPVTGPIQVVTNVVCPKGRLYLKYYQPNIWHIAEAKPMGWYDDGGGIFTKVRGTFLQEATWYWPALIVNERPDLAGKLTDITESV